MAYTYAYALRSARAHCPAGVHDIRGLTSSAQNNFFSFLFLDTMVYAEAKRRKRNAEAQ
jgi:hypothetical protein